METVFLSKSNLCTACVLLLALQQVWLKPRRNKTWTRRICAPPVFSSEQSSKETITALHHDPSFERWSYQLLNFAIFLRLSVFLTWLLWTSLSGAREIWSDLCECFLLTTEENPPRLTIGQRWMGIHAFAASLEKVYLMIHLVSKYISTGS